MRRIVAVFLLMIILLCQTVVFASPPQIGAEAAVLIVAKNRRVLFEKNQYNIMYPASTTKMITLLTALERGNLDSTVTVSSRAAVCDGSSLELKPGDKMTLRDMLYGMMLVSGNDAAEAVAEHVAGSVPAFVDMMNNRVQRMGLLSTHFSNPHGLPDPYNHYTTAFDLANLTAYAYQNPEFVRIVSTPEYPVKFRSRGLTERVTNTNKLLKLYPGANGVKTGYTDAAGECLVAAAKRRDVQLIAVILNSETRWEDAAKLLDYGFQLIAEK